MNIITILLSIFLLTSLTYAQEANNDLIEAEAYFAQERYVDALKVYQKILAGPPSNNAVNARAYSGTCLIYENFGQYEQALESCQKAIQINPKDPELYYRLGIVYGRGGNYQKAQENFLKTVALNPYYPEAYFNAGACYWHQGQYDKALQAYKNFFQIHPGTETARFVIGSMEVHRAGYLKEIEVCQQAIQTGGPDAKTFCSLGITFHQVGQLDNAVGSFKKAIEFSPLYAKAFYNLGVTYQLLNNMEQAQESFRNAIQLDPKYRIIFSRGYFEQNKGQYDKEVGCLQRAIGNRYYVGFADVYYNLGRIYCLQKDWVNLQKQVKELDILARFELVDDLKECWEKNPL